MCRITREHVPAFVKQVVPLTNLTRSAVPFLRTAECQNAFEQLKSCPTNAPILVKAQIDKPFVITIDASNTHVGDVLNQVEGQRVNKPIEYFSMKLSLCKDPLFGYG